jgi:DNA (cytosine-5)-methyltransferase 1
MGLLKKEKLKNGLKLISLFSGVGSLDLGFIQAGFNVVFANETDHVFWKTYEHNFPKTKLSKVSIIDLGRTNNLPDCIGFIGGPPPKNFLNRGRQSGDPRDQLFFEYIRILKEKKPLFFVTEDLIGLLGYRNEKDLNLFLDSFYDSGYNVNCRIYNAGDFGVPQIRSKIFFIGYRKDLGLMPTNLIPFKKDVFLKDVLKDLVNPLGVNSRDTVGNGVVGYNQKYIKNQKSFPKIENNEYMLGDFNNIYMSRNRVKNWEEKSFAILSVAKQIPIHPQVPKMIQKERDLFEFDKKFLDQYRRLTVRECARIQTFPDNFLFLYNHIEDGYKMVGGATPINLVKEIALNIRKDLRI